MNDLVRDNVGRPDGSIPLWGEILAGSIVSTASSFIQNTTAHFNYIFLSKN
jgi:hypothetical protein